MGKFLMDFNPYFFYQFDIHSFFDMSSKVWCSHARLKCIRTFSNQSLAGCFVVKTFHMLHAFASADCVLVWHP